MSHLLAVGSFGNIEFLVIGILYLIGMAVLVRYLIKARSSSSTRLPQSPPPLQKKPPEE